MPATGSDVVALAIAGSSATTLGAALVLAARRRTPA
jgi:LPXTG-motif cell wall-anchored protein